jgi:quinol monooxygenase YgiN
MRDPDLILVADVHGRAALKGELFELLRELADASGEEPDCISFRVLGAEDAADFVLLESWASERALLEHYATAHYRRYRQQVGPMLARPSDVVIHHVSRTVRALDPNPPDPGLLG